MPDGRIRRMDILYLQTEMLVSVNTAQIPSLLPVFLLPDLQFQILPRNHFHNHPFHILRICAGCRIHGRQFPHSQSLCVEISHVDPVMNEIGHARECQTLASFPGTIRLRTGLRKAEDISIRVRRGKGHPSGFIRTQFIKNIAPGLFDPVSEDRRVLRFKAHGLIPVNQRTLFKPFSVPEEKLNKLSVRQFHVPDPGQMQVHIPDFLKALLISLVPVCIRQVLHGQRKQGLHPRQAAVKLQHFLFMMHLESRMANIPEPHPGRFKRPGPFKSGFNLPERPFLPARENGLKHLQYMNRHFLGCPARPSFRNGPCHFRRADSAGIIRITGIVQQHHFLRSGFIQEIGMKPNLSTELIGIRQVQNSAGSVNGKKRLIPGLAVMIHMQRPGHPAAKHQDGGYLTLIGGIHDFPEFRSRQNVDMCPVRCSDDPGNSCHRSQQTGKRRQVVNPVIQQGTGTRLPKKAKQAEKQIVVPVHRDRKGMNFTQQPVIDRGPCRLERRPQKRIRCTAQIKSLFICQCGQLPGTFHTVRQGLFRIHMLAGHKGAVNQIIMTAHGRQNDNHLNSGILQHFLNRTGLNPVFFRFLPRILQMLCRNGNNLKIFKAGDHIGQIDITDSTCSDDTDSHFLPPFSANRLMKPCLSHLFFRCKPFFCRLFQPVPGILSAHGSRQSTAGSRPLKRKVHVQLPSFAAVCAGCIIVLCG